MTNEDLNKLIDQFDENDLKQKGIFGIFQYGGGSDESFIKANKEGLELFALKILKSAKNTEEIINNSEKKHIPFDDDEDWIDENSNTFIHYIEPITEKLKQNNKTTIANKLISFVFIVVVIILLISVLVGVVTIIKWLF